MYMYCCKVIVTANYNILTVLFLLYAHVCNFNDRRFVNLYNNIHIRLFLRVYNLSLLIDVCLHFTFLKGNDARVSVLYGR